MNESALVSQFQEIEDNFNKAVITTNIKEIQKCITNDWVLVDSEGGIIPPGAIFFCS